MTIHLLAPTMHGLKAGELPLFCHTGSFFIIICVRGLFFQLFLFSLISFPSSRMEEQCGARRRRGIFEGEVAWGTAILLSTMSALCMLPKVTWAFFLPIRGSLFLHFVYFQVANLT